MSLALARIIGIRHHFHLSHLCSHVLKKFEPFVVRNMKSSIRQEVTVIIIAIVGGGQRADADANSNANANKDTDAAAEAGGTEAAR